MKKRKNIAIPMILAATIAAVSVPCSSQIVMASDTYQVGVSKGYLALRSAMAYDSSNEIGELYSGDTVEVTEYTTSDYWYVYSPKLNRSVYVNNDYLYHSYSLIAKIRYSRPFFVSLAARSILNTLQR